jgi:hydroxypyruvate isomerase
VPQRNEPNTGVLDYGPVFAVIDASVYSGYVGCEYQPKTTTADGLGWMQQLSP